MKALKRLFFLLIIAFLFASCGSNEIRAPQSIARMVFLFHMSKIVDDQKNESDQDKRYILAFTNKQSYRMTPLELSNGNYTYDRIDSKKARLVLNYLSCRKKSQLELILTFKDATLGSWKITQSDNPIFPHEASGDFEIVNEQ